MSPADEIASTCLAVRMRLLNRRINRLYDEALRPHGLRVGQLNLLVAVARGLRQAAQLAHYLDMDPSTLSRDLEPLKRDGWLRANPAQDKRSRELELTLEGQAVLRDVLPAWREAQREAARLLGPQAVKSFIRAAGLG